MTPRSTRSGDRPVVVIGAGPAGLTAALRLRQADVDTTVLEASDSVGGISRTVERDGWRFDLGGHRFFTKVPEVEAFWHEVLPDEDFLMRPRLSRILYRGKLFDYPLKPFNALFGLGVARGGPLRPVVRPGARPPAEGPEQLRGLGRRALRLAALPHLLQDLHREGVGRARHRHPGRLGGAAHQEPVAAQRHHVARSASARATRSPRSSRSSSTRGSAPG